MKYFKERCTEWLEAECRHTYDSHACESASDLCSNELMGPYMETGLNPCEYKRARGQITFEYEEWISSSFLTPSLDPFCSHLDFGTF